MRLAYLTNRYPAPSHSFIRREIEALEAAGAEVERFSVRSADAANMPDERDQAELGKTAVLLAAGIPRLVAGLIAAFLGAPRRGVAAIRIAFKGADWKVSTLVRRVAYLAEAALLARRMRAAGINHLHAHFGTNPAMVARLASRFSGIPYSFTVHGPDEFDAPVHLDLRGKIADAAFCVAISSYGRSQLMRWSAVADWPRIEVVRCGVDAGFLDRRPVGPQSAARLCAVARLSAQKGIPLLIEAAGRLRDAGRNFELVLVGGGELRTEIEAMIADLDLSQTVQVIGWASSEDVIRHLDEARAMVLPSFAEGLPVVIMEALALERPVIVTAIAGTPELVDGDCGWLIPAGSIDELVVAMGAALDTPPVALGAMGAVGRQRVIDRHDARANGWRLYDLITRHHEGRAA